MLTEFQKQKLTALFQISDLNNDGFLEKNDYEEFANRVCRVLEFRPGSAEYDLVQTQTVAVWEDEQLKAFDTDHDNRVSLAEHLAAYEVTLSNPEIFDKYLLEYTQSIAGLWDQDGDGKLSSAEYMKLLWCYGIESETAVLESFQHLDRNGDEYLSITELETGLEEFFLSDDPAAPGNWLLGPIEHV